jgi:WD40 repeat protein
VHLVTVVARADVKPGAAPAGEVKLWDARSGVEVRGLRVAEYPLAAFSPDGKHLAVGEYNLTRVLNTETGGEVAALKHPHGRVSSLAFSPDGKHLATAAAGRMGATGVWETAARVWDLRTGAQALTLRGHTAGVTGVAYSPDGAHILTNSIDRTARMWDAESGVELLAVAVPKGHDHGAAFSTDGRRIITRGGATVSVWDAETGPIVLRGHTKMVTGAAFSRDGERVVTVSRGGEKSAARVWDVATGTTALTLGGSGAGAFSPDGKRIVTGGSKTARVWDAESGAERLLLKGHSESITGVAFSPDGRRIATASSDGTSRVWDAETGAERQVIRGERGREYSVAFDRDSRLAVGSEAGPVRVYNSETGAEQFVLRGACAPVAFSSDGRLATGSNDLTARVWDAKTGAEVLRLRGHTEVISSLAFSPDGTRIVTGCGDHRRDTPGRPCDVKVWDAVSGVEKLTLRGHMDAVGAVAFSADGTRLVTGSDDKTARVWDATPVSREFLPREAAPLSSSK